MPQGKAAQRLKLDRFAICVYQRARRSRSTLPPLRRYVTQLFLDLDFANHSQISIRDFLVRSAAPPQPKFSPRMTRMNANRKESSSRFREALGVRHSLPACVWVFVSLWIEPSMESGARAPHSKSPEIAGRNRIMIRVNWRDSRATNLRKTRRFSPIAVQRTRSKNQNFLLSVISVVNSFV
jgi:hypothetical protein